MPPPSFLRRWQFSIRELLMLTVIVALLLTVWRLVDLGDLQTTAFFNSFEPANEMKSIARELGHPIPSGGGWGRWSHGIRKFRYSYKLPDGGNPRSFLAAFQESVVERLAEAGCTVSNGVSTANAPQGFSIEYRHGSTGGTVDAEADFQAGKVDVFVLIHEFNAR